MAGKNTGIISGIMDVREMEPMLPPEREVDLASQAMKLVVEASRLSGQMQWTVRKSIGDLVRSMNCYYSNFIEGHNTHPRDIDAALEGDYSSDPQRRMLQREARAHIEVQRMIDDGDDPKDPPTSEAYVKWIHREFCCRLPEELLWAEDPKIGERERVVPGEYRNGDVIVGRHIAPPPADLPKFMAHFQEAYGRKRMPEPQAIIAVAAAHHRFLWVHPFYDGNGRVARLMAHSMLLRCGIGSSIWSVARGLARNAHSYQTMLSAADASRQDDDDVPGARSAGRLDEFCSFFLCTCIDQVKFMGSLLQPKELLRRIQLYADDEEAAGRLPARSGTLLRETLLAGEVERGRAPEITGYRERRSREILSTLLKKGLLVSDGPRAPVRLGFPMDVVDRWFPRLYPVD